MKVSAVVMIALTSIVLAACSSHANKDAMKEHKMTDTMKKETMMKNEAMMKKEAMMKAETMMKKEVMAK